MTVFLLQPWLMALIPVGLAIMPINKLTILLLLVLAADVAIGLLLAEDFRQYRMHTVPVKLDRYSHRLRRWGTADTRGNEMAVNIAQIENFDAETTSTRCAALVSISSTQSFSFAFLRSQKVFRGADGGC